MAEDLNALALVARADLAARLIRSTGIRVGRRIVGIVRDEFKAARARLYDAAATGRQTSGWQAGQTSANAEIGAAANVLRARARDLARNNPIAIKIMSELTTGLIGTGLQPRPNTGDPKLDERAVELWKRWSKQADVMHDLTIEGLQVQGARAMFESGEVFLRRRWRRASDGLAVPLQVQILEADYCPQWLYESLDNGGRVIQGIELDALTRRVAYRLLPYHPGDAYSPIGIGGAPGRIPADDVAHLFAATVGRPGQVRGVPWLSGVADDIRDLDDYGTAERMRKKIEACLAAFVIGNDEGDEDGIAELTDSLTGDKVEQFEPGMIAIARGAKEIKMNTPQGVGGFGEFKSCEQHDIAAGALVPYEQATGDLSQVNYSSIRLGAIGFRAAMRQLRELVFVPLFCDPIWQWFVEAAITAGALPPGDYPVRWSTPRTEDVDRAKEAQADVIELRSGLASLRDKLEARGLDYVAHLDALAAQAKDLADRGLAFDWTIEPAAAAPEPAPPAKPSAPAKPRA